MMMSGLGFGLPLPQVPWFESFAINCGNFLESFILVKPITFEAHFSLYSSLALMGCACSYKSGFLR